MASVVQSENIISLIIQELERLDKFEQQEYLVQLRAKRLSRRKLKPLATLSGGVKPLTMAQIDKIKHLSRKRG